MHLGNSLRSHSWMGYQLLHLIAIFSTHGLLAINVVIAFNMGTNISNITSSPVGQPMAVILFNSFGKHGTLAVWSFIIVVQFMMGTSILTAGSRLMFALSRDGALPFSRFLYQINPHTKTPVVCVWAVGCLSAFVALMPLAGPAATSAIFTLPVVGQYTAISIAVVARFLGGRKFKPGPFYLGRLSPIVNTIAVIWMTFMALVLLFPSTPDPHAATMNYTVVVLGGILFLASVYFFFPLYGGMYWFKGPIRTVGDVGPDQVREGSVDSVEKK